MPRSTSSPPRGRSCPSGWRNRSARASPMAETPYRSLSAADRRDALRVAEAGLARTVRSCSKRTSGSSQRSTPCSRRPSARISPSRAGPRCRRHTARSAASPKTSTSPMTSGPSPPTWSPMPVPRRCRPHAVRSAAGPRRSGPVSTPGSPTKPRRRLKRTFNATGFEPRVRAEAECLHIGYEPLFDDYAFVRPEVTVEFGARSTGEPRTIRPVECDAAPFLPDLLFPRARPSVMLAERTFWEKATAIHVFCRQERKRGERLSRHWHDLATTRRCRRCGPRSRRSCDRAVGRPPQVDLLPGERRC